MLLEKMSNAILLADSISSIMLGGSLLIAFKTFSASIDAWSPILSKILLNKK